MRGTVAWIGKVVSTSIAVSIVFAAILSFGPMTVEAPPTVAGTLNVTWKSMAPWTNTFQGDVNLTMLWLALEAEGADITLNNITVDVYEFPPEGINRTFAWDDRNYDENMSFAECIIAEDASSPYLLPPNGIMVECAGPEAGELVVIDQGQTRYFMIYLDLDFDPTQNLTDRELRVCIEDGNISSSASTTTGLPACSRTIDINRRFFYDDMEHGQGNWTFTGGDDGGVHPDGLWHMSQGEEDCINNVNDMPFYHSERISWWYGHRLDWFGDWQCFYYTNQSGAPFVSTRNWGELITPWIDARKGTSLAMTQWHHLAREPVDGVDVSQVFLQDDQGWHLISTEKGTDTYWRKLSLNLSDYAGELVQLKFKFDTMDELGNMFFGWFIDDLAVYGEVLEHDIAVTELTDLPDYVFLEPRNISARVSNIAMKDEYNIEVNLTQNGTTIDKQTIPYLASEENTTVTFSWNPPGIGVYDICIETTPVSRETVLWNNYRCRQVNVTARNYSKIAILRSYGTQKPGPIETWDYLNANWYLHGEDVVEIDYTSLNIHPITYEAIAGTGADVLVLSGSGYYFVEPIGTELDDEEIAAIQRWTREGHGFVTIGSAFNSNISNNNGLVDLVGIVDRPFWIGGDANSIRVFPECTNHPIFRNVSSTFLNAFGPTMLPSNDWAWNDSDLEGGQYCAKSTGTYPNGDPIWTAAVVIYKGNVMISIVADVMPNFDEKQLLYNTFVWSQFEVFDYDVEASINAPRFAEPFFPVNIRSTVANVGKKDLSTIRVDLKVDGSVIDTKNISSLVHLERSHLYFTWTPSALGTYQLCTYAEIVGITDEDPSNNEACMPVEITDDVPVQVYILDSWGTDFAHEAPWDYLTENWTLLGDIRIDINYTRFNKERISYEELVDSYADVLLISSSRSGYMDNPAGWGYYFAYNERNAIRRYVQEGHGLIGTGLTLDWEKLPEHGYAFGPLFGLKAWNLYTYLTGLYNLSIINPIEMHPLFYRIPVGYDTEDGTTCAPGIYVVDPPYPPYHDYWIPLNWTADLLDGGEYKAMAHPDNNATVITHDPGVYKAAYITNFVEKNSNWYDKQLLYNAMVWTGYDSGVHDVALSNLTVPNRVRPFAVDITATLTNLGNVFEDNAAQGIDVYLTVDGFIVDQRNIPSLDIGESKNVTLTWDPPDSPIPETYYVCMRAWPVRWEINTLNNEVCKNIEVIDPDLVIVVILDSWGTDNPVLAPWDEISTNWATYGPHPIDINYTYLDKEDITLMELINSSADVLVISSSNSTMLPTAEFTLSEIDAIQTYVQTMEHGIVGTGLTLSTIHLPNNNLLAPMFGIDAMASFTNTAGVWTYQQLQPTHSVFFQMPDPFFTGSGLSCTPGLSVPDPNGWVPSILLEGGEYLADATPPPPFGAVIANDNASYRGIYLTSFMEMLSSDDDRQMLYTAIVWAAGRNLYPALPPDTPEEFWITIVGDRLKLNWTVADPKPDVWFNIFRAPTVDGFNFNIPYDQVTAPPYHDISGTATNPNNYYYVVRAINITSGMSETNTNKVGKFYNQLHKGTNDISIPFQLNNTSVEAVFDAISVEIREVAVYDSATAMWLRWTPGIGGSLTDVDNTMGIRVISKRKNLGFVTVGIVPKTTMINLTISADAWFFVGYPNFKVNALPGILDNHGLAGLYVLVLHYDPTDRKAPWKWYDPNDPGGSPLREFETGKGYWIFMSVSGTWRVPGE